MEIAFRLAIFAVIINVLEVLSTREYVVDLDMDRILLLTRGPRVRLDHIMTIARLDMITARIGSDSYIKNV